LSLWQQNTKQRHPDYEAEPPQLPSTALGDYRFGFCSPDNCSFTNKPYFGKSKYPVVGKTLTIEFKALALLAIALKVGDFLV